MDFSKKNKQKTHHNMKRHKIEQPEHFFFILLDHNVKGGPHTSKLRSQA